MADQVMNISKGRFVEFMNRVDSNDPANSVFVVVLLKASEADATLIDYDDLSTLLGAAGNTEADFTNYARKTLSDADVTFGSPDDTNNDYTIDIADQTWTSAGGASNNTLTKFLFCYDSDSTGGTDANILPIAHFDFAITTNGGNLTATINAAGLIEAA